MEINKKGVFFSLTSLLVIGVLLVTIQADANRQSVNYVQVQLQDFQYDITQLQEQQLPSMLEEYTRQALNEIARANIERLALDDPLLDQEKELTNCLVTTSDDLVDEQQTTTRDCESSQELNFTKTLERVEAAMKKQQYNASIELLDINITPNGAWDLNVEATFAIQVEKDTGDIRTNKNVEVFTPISVVGLIDPISSHQRAKEHTIQRTPRENANTSEFFLRHANTGTYIVLNESPSYLERLQGENKPSGLTPPEYGISSLITFETETQARNMYSFDNGNRTVEDQCVYIIDVGAETGGPYVSLSPQHIRSYIQSSEESYGVNAFLTDDTRSKPYNCDELEGQ